jgi:hypothetical protein
MDLAFIWVVLDGIAFNFTAHSVKKTGTLTTPLYVTCVCKTHRKYTTQLMMMMMII